MKLFQLQLDDWSSEHRGGTSFALLELFRLSYVTVLTN